MSLGLIGRKVGMTRIFAEDGTSVPVTVVDVANNRVTQVKTQETDGYTAVQVGFGTRRVNRVTKALQGHFAKAGVEAACVLKEFRVNAEEAEQFQVGQALAADGVFQVGQALDVTGTSQGKGFQGVIKRHNFSSNRASHGNSVSHNKPGSIGQAQDPGRIFPGKKMPGHMGNVQRTMQNVKLVRIDAERQLLLVKGAVPGSEGGTVFVRPSVKG